MPAVGNKERLELSPCSARLAKGRLWTADVITFACWIEMVPAACAAATTGYNGDRAPPPKSVRGPISRAALSRGRRFAWGDPQNGREQCAGIAFAHVGRNATLVDRRD